ncbi:GatB/YqeY domain-containing protein [Natronoglycomyces albus]|uniref:GatB/YqeY domain-containing protein n=1 Tax=Natronoglycomyces albus TaxID=2811108 RepID=A0A895XQT4_9ACTN|nr:GatB/YqeY domain-containing protein [Natronoglycomyces albus]QSB05515.1 GatB/YqeY domain-containing protein [Natronoglycomyces albus]
MSELKTRLETDMRQALKSGEKVKLNTLRMALTAVRNAEVAGKQARELDDAEVVKVLTKQAKQRREAAEAFDAAGRTEQADLERAEEEILALYLPKQLSEDELEQLVAQAISEGGFAGPQDMGKVMKALQPQVAGRADGKVVSSIVRAKLAG